ncbi:MAG: cysteine desulfurase [Clostridiales bacterium]|uniref:cysteine desulfurase family protein n=1 Tax=Clostridium sp. N3C TaxID=1776758 RepID=UPI00092DF6B4|nr:cysteine desulfurase family protein [Clostridium sp. N3C]NLZ49618.1 cysteine desulfurase [Clostridiales bacterium]SCN22914.1 Cysteine desulfurase [Clostridium sp. N3C]
MQVYFDNGATTQPFDEVVELVAQTMKNNFGNPSSAHGLGLKAEKALNEARDVAAKTINCTRDEIIFTSGGSESNNFLVKGFTSAGAHIITTEIEHPSILNTFKDLEMVGAKVTYLKVDQYGRISLKDLENSISNQTRLVSIMHVNNEIGTIQDIESIGALIKEKSPRVKFHVDAVQSYGKLKIDVKKAQIDLLSVSGHKIHGPRGVGFSYIKKGFYPKALISGGGQERNFRSGTENLPGIVGMAKAAEIMYTNIEKNYLKAKELKEYFIESLKSLKDIKINSPSEEFFSPYILSVSFLGVRGEVLLHLLEEKGIYVSTGSACSSNHNADSHVLKAIGLSTAQTKGTIRFSFSEFNTKEEVDYTMEVLEKSLKFLRRK